MDFPLCSIETVVATHGSVTDLHENHDASVSGYDAVAASVAVDAQVSSEEAHATARPVVERNESKALADAA